MSVGISAATPELSELIALHYLAVASDAHKDHDCHWSICERWSYGRHVGWVVEHHGYCYDALEDGEEGPFPTREEAEIVMADHLRRAIAGILRREGG